MNTARAICDFDAVEDREISFEEGDIVRILGMPPGDWWQAEHGGHLGWIPKSHVELIVDESSAGKAAALSNSSTVNETKQELRSEQQAVRQTMEFARARVLYPFDAQPDSQELQLDVGDEVYLQQYGEQENWWFGVTASGEGWFPSAYVQIEEIGCVPLDDQGTTDGGDSNDAQPLESEEQLLENIGERASFDETEESGYVRVVKRYEKAQDNEMSLELGMVLKVIYDSNSNYLFGSLLDHSDSPAWFPSANVVYISEAEALQAPVVITKSNPLFNPSPVSSPVINPAPSPSAPKPVPKAMPKSPQVQAADSPSTSTSVSSPSQVQLPTSNPGRLPSKPAPELSASNGTSHNDDSSRPFDVQLRAIEEERSRIQERKRIEEQKYLDEQRAIVEREKQDREKREQDRQRRAKEEVEQLQRERVQREREIEDERLRNQQQRQAQEREERERTIMQRRLATQQQADEDEEEEQSQQPQQRSLPRVPISPHYSQTQQQPQSPTYPQQQLVSPSSQQQFSSNSGEIQELKKQIEALKVQTKQYQDLYETERTRSTQLSQTVAEVTASREEIRSQMASEHRTLLESQQEVGEVRARLESQKENTQRVRRELEEMSRKYDQTFAQLNTLTAEKTKLEESARKHAEAEKRLQEKLEQQSDQIRRLNSDHDVVSRQLSWATEKVATLESKRDEAESLQRQLHSSQTRNLQLTEELARHAEQVAYAMSPKISNGFGSSPKPSPITEPSLAHSFISSPPHRVAPPPSFVPGKPYSGLSTQSSYEPPPRRVIPPPLSVTSGPLSSRNSPAMLAVLSTQSPVTQPPRSNGDWSNTYRLPTPGALSKPPLTSTNGPQRPPRRAPPSIPQ